MTDKPTTGNHQPAENAHAAQTGNASNPSPQDGNMPTVDEQVISPKGEKYLREAGNIEDEPDAQDQEEMEETIRRQRNGGK